jgi:hypothetical protein
MKWFAILFILGVAAIVGAWKWHEMHDPQAYSVKPLGKNGMIYSFHMTFKKGPELDELERNLQTIPGVWGRPGIWAHEIRIYKNSQGSWVRIHPSVVQAIQTEYHTQLHEY